MQNALKCQSENYWQRTEMTTSDRKPRKTGAKPDAGPQSAVPRLPGEMLMANLLALLKDWSGYGYQLAQRLEQNGFAGFNSGSLYRTLRQMENLGLISSFWDTSSTGPARRMYSLTQAGRLFLNNWIAMLDFHRRALDLYLGGNTAEPAEDPPEAPRPAKPPSTGKSRSPRPKRATAPTRPSKTNSRSTS
jgi:poly-beta-hydroxybutyrate-responsive repressor